MLLHNKIKRVNTLKNRPVVSRLVFVVCLCLGFAGTAFAAGRLPLNTVIILDVPEQLLSQSLIQLGREAELTIIIQKRHVDGLMAPRLQGEMTIEQALARVLNNSGLGVKSINATTLSISPDYLTLPADNSEGDQGVPEEFGAPVIEEVLVSSQRRTENLQKVAQAVSVLTEEQLLQFGITDLGSIGLKVPGLTVSYFSLGQPSIHMRGIGSNDDGVALDNSVVLYLDDIYVGRITSIDINLLDIEQVEVLRGPQGSLYGKNTIGGAVMIKSNMPHAEPTIDIEATMGNYDRQSLSVIANGPLAGHELLGRLAISGLSQAGWQKNGLTADDEQHGRNNHNARVKLLYQPRDNFSAYIGADYTRDNLNSTGRIPVAGRVPVRTLDNNGDPIPLRDGLGNIIVDNSGETVFETRLPTELFNQLGGDYQRAMNGTRGFTDRTIYGMNSRLSWSTDAGQLMLISGYRESDFSWLEDSTGLPKTATDQTVDVFVDERHQQVSQELRWTSLEQGRMSYVLGVYSLYEKTRRDEQFFFSAGDAQVEQGNTTNSYATFGQLDYQLSEKLKMNLGGRYTLDRKEMHQQSASNDAKGIILEEFDVNNHDRWHDFSPSFGLSYQQSGDRFYYVGISRGFKSGGFQGAPGTLASAQRKIDPESAWNYELGMKSQWLQNRLRLNVVGFYTKYRDLQVVQFRTIDNFGLFETSNAASATLQGVEIEFTYHPLEGLQLSGYYAYLDAVYDEFNDVIGRDFKGNSLRQAPEDSFNLQLSYQYPLSGGVLIAGIDYRYQSKSYREPDNDVTIQPGFDLVDASLTFAASNNRWRASLWSKNLTDEEYISHLYVLGGNDYALFGAPRTFGVSLAWAY